MGDRVWNYFNSKYTNTGRNNDPGVRKKTLQLTETVSQSLCYTAKMGPSVMRDIYLSPALPLDHALSLNSQPSYGGCAFAALMGDVLRVSLSQVSLGFSTPVTTSVTLLAQSSVLPHLSIPVTVDLQDLIKTGT